MKPTRASPLQRHAFAVHLATCGLMLLAPAVMLLAVRAGWSAGVWAGLGAFILANLLELLIS